MDVVSVTNGGQGFLVGKGQSQRSLGVGCALLLTSPNFFSQAPPSQASDILGRNQAGKGTVFRVPLTSSGKGPGVEALTH